MIGPKMRGQIVCTSPMTVIFKAEPVSAYTNHNSATLFRPSPTCETTCPDQRNPKSRVLSSRQPLALSSVMPVPQKLIVMNPFVPVCLKMGASTSRQERLVDPENVKKQSRLYEGLREILRSP